MWIPFRLVRQHLEEEREAEGREEGGGGEREREGDGIGGGKARVVVNHNECPLNSRCMCVFLLCG